MLKSAEARGLLALTLLALALRLASVALIGSATSGPVTYEHGEIAANLLAGRGFSVKFLGAEGPTSQQAPLYPLLLAGCMWAAGPHAILLLQIIQSLAGAATVVVTVRLAWSLIPERRAIGWIAGLLLAVYPPHVYMVTHVQVVTWASLLLVSAMALAASPRWNRTISGAILTGCVCGLLLLVDPILAIALPAVAMMRLISRNLAPSGRDAESARQRGAYLQIVILAATAALLVSPWVARNYAVHHRFVFVKSTFGYAFWQGNNPLSRGTDKIPQARAIQRLHEHDGSLADTNRALWAARHGTLYIDDVALTAADRRQLATLPEPERSAMLGRRAWQFFGQQPLDYLRLCGLRLRYFLLWDATNPKAANLLYRASSVAWLALVVAGALGAGPYWRRLWPLAAALLAVLVFHTLTIYSARFRMPVEPLALVWASTGIFRGFDLALARLRATLPAPLPDASIAKG